eukprot:g17726.t1
MSRRLLSGTRTTGQWLPRSLALAESAVLVEVEIAQSTIRTWELLFLLPRDKSLEEVTMTETGLRLRATVSDKLTINATF